MLKLLRRIVALVFFLCITFLLLDVSGVAHRFLGWMARIQLLPAVMALNFGVIAFLVVLTLVFGRVYCSVICPLGVFQDGISRLGNIGRKQPYRYRKELKWLRYGIWVLFVIALVTGLQCLVAFLAPYSAYGRMVESLLQPVWLWGNNLLASISQRAGSYAFYSREVWLRSLPTLIVAAVTLVVLVVLAWRGGRTYCNAVCPVGTTLSFFSRFALLRPVIDASKCRNCRKCEHGCKAQCIDIDSHSIDYSRCVDCFNCIGECKFDALSYRPVWGRKKASPKASEGSKEGEAPKADDSLRASRRAFLGATALFAGTSALKAQGAKKVDGGFAQLLPKQAHSREVPLTPPGSASVKDFYRRCTACQLCVAQCPNNVLRPSSDPEHFMQPCMSYERGFCRPECTRCSQLCPSGAIKPIGKEEKTQYRIGVAQIDRDLCLQSRGEGPCGKCVQACPSGAVSFVNKDGVRIPVVAEEVCIGCGACEYLCPVRPISAITVNGRNTHLL